MNARLRTTLQFDAGISANVREQVGDILRGWSLPQLEGQFTVTALSGGGSNVNLKMDRGDCAFALRICAPDPDRWCVSRAASIQAQSDAAAADLAPRILASRLPEGHFLTPFLPGGVLTSARMRMESLLPAVVETLRSLHRLQTSARDFSPFEDAHTFVRLGNAEGARRPAEFDEFYAKVLRIEALFLTVRPRRAFCHSDLVPQNFIVGDRLRLLDWDYAGNGWVAFELASFACQAQLSDAETELFLSLYDPTLDDGQRARVALMRSVAGVREAAWATMAEPILASSTTPLEGWTYQGYAAANLDQARRVWAGGSFNSLLKAAQQVRPGALF